MQALTVDTAKRVRRTKKQIETALAYELAIYHESNYLNSVFVTPAGIIVYAAEVACAKAAMEAACL